MQMYCQFCTREVYCGHDSWCPYWIPKVKSELETFDGRDNRKEIMLLLVRLSTDKRRAAFIESLIPDSNKGFANCPMKVTGNCDPISAYYMMVSVCNELGVSINVAARKLEQIVKRGPSCHSG